MSHHFEGYYYKHQKDNHTLCLISGVANSQRFIQVITPDFSCSVPFSEGNEFSTRGVKLNIQRKDLSLKGEIHYGTLSPIKYDIMGPFRYFPMECRHGIISMHHSLEGSVTLNGTEIDFSGGKGYIEKDSGKSFPKEYIWVQANDFSENASIMAAAAHIPFYGLQFQGCICIVQYQGKEYRLATYLGAKVISCSEKQLILKQGKFRLEVQVFRPPGHPLKAPEAGEMTRIITEVASCAGKYKFYIKDRLLFHLDSKGTSFEFER